MALLAWLYDYAYNFSVVCNKSFADVLDQETGEALQPLRCNLRERTLWFELECSLSELENTEQALFNPLVGDTGKSVNMTHVPGRRNMLVKQSRCSSYHILV